MVFLMVYYEYMTPSNKKTLGIVIVLIIIIVIIFALSGSFSKNGPSSVEVTPTVSPTVAVATPTPALSHSTKEITFSVPDGFGFAISEDQILQKGYIPACDPSFDYCVYALGQYPGTNFDSAGIRIQKRTDLGTDQKCLNTVPDGFSGLKPKISLTTTDGFTYTTSLFTPLGDAGAGHYATGDVYRLAYKKTCYEFQTRVGATQFANYPAGTIKEFTAADQAALMQKLRSFVNGITFTDTQAKIVFPQ